MTQTADHRHSNHATPTAAAGLLRCRRVASIRQRFSDDRGFAPVEMPLAVGLLLLPIAMIIMLIPQWPERQTIATAAAKDAATIYANAPDSTSGAVAAVASVAQAAANYGLAPTTMTVTLDGNWCRGCTVTANVTIVIPAVDIPLAGTVGSFTWTASSSARIDDYRSLTVQSEVTP